MCIFCVKHVIHIVFNSFSKNVSMVFIIPISQIRKQARMGSHFTQYLTASMATHGVNQIDLVQNSTFVYSVAPPSGETTPLMPLSATAAGA